MTCTTEISTATHTSIAKEAKCDRLVIQWLSVDNRLVCQWITVKD